MSPTLGYAAATAPGPVRTVNEDAVAADRTVLLGEAAVLTTGLIDPAADALFVVVDGMGGHPCGWVASRLVASNLAGDPPGFTEASCADAVRRTNLDLHMMMVQRPETLGMGAVLAGVVFRGAATCWFNVGDSRVYHSLSDGRLLQLSIDDVCAAPADSQRPPAVSAALGGRRTIVPIAPHTGCATLAVGDRLMLCSDGITTTLSEPAIAAILRSAPTPAEAVQSLLEACHHSMARDNFSVVVVGHLAA